MSAIGTSEMESEKSMMRPFAPRVTAASFRAKKVWPGAFSAKRPALASSSSSNQVETFSSSNSSNDPSASLDAHGSASPSQTISTRRLLRRSLTVSPASAAATMATTPSSLSFARKPNLPKLMPKIGTPVVPMARAVRRMVPSPPRTTARSTPRVSCCETRGLGSRPSRSDESNIA